MDGEPALLVLDDNDQNFQGAGPFNDRLRLLTADGKELWSISGFNNAQSVGAGGRVVVDRDRERIYVCDDVGRSVTAISLNGQRVWQVSGMLTGVLALDEKTGNLWVSGGGGIGDGQTVVLDPDGRDVTSYPYGAVDMAYDPHDDAFWIVSNEVIKLNLRGQGCLSQERAGMVLLFRIRRPHGR